MTDRLEAIKAFHEEAARHDEADPDVLWLIAEVERLREELRSTGDNRRGR